MQREIKVARAYGPVVEGEALLSDEGFSPRYDLDRWSGVITKPGHRLEGKSIVDKVCFFPSAKGGIAAGWAFYDIKWKKIAPKAFIFGVTNPVMVQGAVFAGITLWFLGGVVGQVTRAGACRLGRPRRAVTAGT
jgi:uncharacterized protein